VFPWSPVGTQADYYLEEKNTFPPQTPASGPIAGGAFHWPIGVRTPMAALANKDAMTQPCIVCGSLFYAARSDSKHCSSVCRLKDYRARQARHRDLLDRLLAQRARLAAQADAALASGDVAELTAVARRAAALLAA